MIDGRFFVVGALVTRERRRYMFCNVTFVPDFQINVTRKSPFVLCVFLTVMAPSHLLS